MSHSVLTKCPESFVQALRRVHRCQSSVAYNNVDGTLRFVVNHNEEGSAGKFMTFDLIVSTADEAADGGRLERIVDLDHEIYQEDDEDDVYELEMFEFLVDDPCPTTVRAMMDLVNQTYEYKICSCQKYLIKDASDLCFFCQLTADADGLRKETCPICLDEAYMMHMKKTPCCGQLVHRACTSEWSLKGKTKACALCRGSSGEDEPPAKRFSFTLDIDDVTAHIVAAINAPTPALVEPAVPAVPALVEPAVPIVHVEPIVPVVPVEPTVPIEPTVE